MQNPSQHLWWQTGIIYEIYVRSFQDSNGDGIGDLQGIISRLDYLQWLGVTVLWLTPIYPSPMKDFGYDISDYTGIHPLFGTMEDFDQLLAEVHARNMKLVLDFVPNHTSDQHPWFQESRSSRDHPKRDWYYWKEGSPDGSPPNNWLGVLGGSAWELDGATGQYYYHAFLKEQPDLNLKNPEVREAIFEVMRFWLDKGVDGFRIDVMWHLAKDEQWRDNPPNPDYQPHMPSCDQLVQVYNCDQPEVHGLIRSLRKVMEEYGERVMIGEIYLPLDKIVAYYGPDNQGAHLPANFQLLFVPWNALKIGLIIDEYEGALPNDAWPNWVIGNHDRPRLISRIGEEQARIAAMLLLTLRGTPTIYYGDEIGMSNVPIPPEEIQDPQGLLMPGKNLSRDPQRTPMQWSAAHNAGFTTGKPWLRLDGQFAQKNVCIQQEDPGSLLSLYKRLAALRRSEPSLCCGTYRPVHADQKLLAYIRQAESRPAFLVVLNLSREVCFFDPKHLPLEGKVVLSTSREREGTAIHKPFHLNGNEGVIVELRAKPGF